ncbi:putative transcription factor interactor and regulator C3H-WRC/GRF family [Helianthus anomalus]
MVSEGCSPELEGLSRRQWMELEHQALIYKYITVNASIPSNLLIPIRKALEQRSSSFRKASKNGTGSR